MQEIKAYKLSNGAIVESKEDAIKIQGRIDFEESVWDFADTHVYGGAEDQIRNVILEHTDELFNILKTYYGY